MANTIATRISFEGADDIKRKLEELGQAGQKVFQQIGKAADDVGFDKLGETSAAAAEGIAKTGEASQKTAQELDKVKQSTDQASESMSKFSLETVRVLSEIGANLTEMGKNIADTFKESDTLFKVLISSLLRLTGVVGPSRVALLGLEAALGTTAVALGLAGTAAAGAVIAIGSLGTAAAAAAAPYEKLNHDLQMLAQSSGRSFDSLQRGEALFGLMGLSAETFRGTIGELGKAIKDLDVGKELKKSAGAVAEANDKVIQKQRELIDLFQPAGANLESYTQQVDKTKQAEKELAEAQKEAREKSLNSLKKVLEQVKAIEAGQKGIKFDKLVTAESKIAAVAASLKEAEKAGKDVSQVFLQFVAAADRASAIDVGKKFGLSEEHVDRVRRLKGGLAELNAEAARLKAQGVLIPPQSAAALEKMRTETQATERAWERLNQAWQSSVFAAIGAQIVALIEPIKQGFANIAAAALEATNAFFRMPGAFAAISAGIATVVAIFSGPLLIGIAAVGTAIVTLITFWPQLSSAAQRAFAAISAGIATVVAIFGGPLLIGIAAVGAAIVTLIAYWPQLSSAAQTAWNFIVTGAQTVKQFLDAWVITPVSGAWKWIQDTFSSAVGGLQSTMDAATGWVQKWVTTPVANAWQWIVDTWNAMLAKLGFGGGSSSGIAPDTSGGGSFARGGLLGGRGTGTSDSNLAWVSRGEHIMPARAVSQPGVLAFLEALRRSGGDLSRVLDGMGRFARGGPVSMPALAGSGLAGMSHVTIAFPGMPEISGLRASSDVVAELQRAAAMAQVRSGGRKPSRYT